MRKPLLVAAVAALSSLVGVVPLSHAQRATTTSTAAPSERPNIVVIMTDDQDAASVKYMPHVKELLTERGVKFTQHTVVFPICCPSRSGYLTGQVGHNNHVRGNTPPEGGYDNLDTSQTLPVWLSEAGYTTTHLGKYPNGYDGHQHPETGGVPPGYSEWHGALDPTTYLFYNYVLNENGVDVPHGRTEADYQTDVLTGLATDYIDRNAPEDAPFFLDVAYLAPHWEIRPGSTGDVNVGDLEGSSGAESSIGVPPVPAPRHLGMFANAKAPRGPAFNEEDVSDKPTYVRDMDPLTDGQIDQIDRWYRKRLASLQAIDEGIEQIVNALDESGELDNTYLIFTSDNGWMQGQHRISLQKVRAYTEASVVPLTVIGPGVKQGEKVLDPTSHVDLPATILDLAGAAPPASHKLDGMSLAPYLRKPHLRLGRAVFQETSADEAGYYSVLTGRWKYVEYNNGDRELYDLVADPYQLTSLHREPSTKPVRQRLAKLIDRFRDCAGEDCVVTGFSAS
ncbi:MAG: N-acetylglucosamine-6-sulfatase [Actinomycetota bacterium]|nr:N-acetylglucosamine-6-sulfatase [Actinomycetota bacterium]